jgi:hypothetical protein
MTDAAPECSTARTFEHHRRDTETRNLDAADEAARACFLTRRLRGHERQRFGFVLPE